MRFKTLALLTAPLLAQSFLVQPIAAQDLAEQDEQALGCAAITVAASAIAQNFADREALVIVLRDSAIFWSEHAETVPGYDADIFTALLRERAFAWYRRFGNADTARAARIEGLEKYRVCVSAEERIREERTAPQTRAPLSN